MRWQDAVTIRLLLAVGALVAAPVGLHLLDGGRIRRVPGLVALVCCIGYAAAVAIGSGTFAVVLALPFAGAATLLAIVEARALLTRPSLDRVGIALATAWLAAAAAVTCLALADQGMPLTPEHLRWPTPAHFLFAGFGLTTIALCVHRDRRRVGSLLALAAVFTAMPLLAIEIAWFPSTQWTGAVAMATAAVLVAVQQLLVAVRVRGLVRLGLALSGASVAAAMVLACAYGLATHFRVASPTLATMVQVHGVLNSVGFVLLGLIAWRVRERGLIAVDPVPVEAC